MVSSVHTAISGMMASSKRIANSANNVANLKSTHSRIDGKTVKEPYKPQDVQQTSLQAGGVRAELRDRDPATFDVYEPSSVAADDDGVVHYPNVDLAEEAVEQIGSAHTYRANLSVVKAQNTMLGSLLDIQS